MAEPISISTSKYVKSGKANVDGKTWDVVLPGAGTELRFSQSSRSLKLAQVKSEAIEKKINEGTHTDADIELYEEYINTIDKQEQFIYSVFYGLFNDGTPDNSEVKKWVDETPTVVLIQAFDDLKGQNEPTS